VAEADGDDLRRYAAPGQLPDLADGVVLGTAGACGQRVSRGPDERYQRVVPAFSLRPSRQGDVTGACERAEVLGLRRDRKQSGRNRADIALAHDGATARSDGETSKPGCRRVSAAFTTANIDSHLHSNTSGNGRPQAISIKWTFASCWCIVKILLRNLAVAPEFREQRRTGVSYLKGKSPRELISPTAICRGGPATPYVKFLH
jgi:hypothetical protein